LPKANFFGFYHSHRDKLQTKFITTLKGPTTLVLETTTDEKEHFFELQKYKDKFITNISDSDMDERKYISENIKGTRIHLTNNNGLIFVAGDKDKCLIHSEPKHDDERIFLSILPGTKEEIDELNKRTKENSKKTKY